MAVRKRKKAKKKAVKRKAARKSVKKTTKRRKKCSSRKMKACGTCGGAHEQ